MRLYSYQDQLEGLNQLTGLKAGPMNFHTYITLSLLSGCEEP